MTSPDRARSISSTSSSGRPSTVNRSPYTRATPVGSPAASARLPRCYDRPVTSQRSLARRRLGPRLPALARSRSRRRRRGATARRSVDADGREYLDAAGRRDRRQRRPRPAVDRRRRSPTRPARLAYAHGSAFTTEPLEAYAARGRPRAAGRRPGDLPGQRRLGGDRDRPEAGPRLPPRSRRGRPLDRDLALGQLPRQHARRARPVRAAAAPSPVRGVARSASATSRPPTRTAPASPTATPSATPTTSPRSSSRRSRRPARTVAAFVAEPIVGATLGAAVPPDGYWPAIAEVCRRHGVLLIADEVMTGFGRTGRWFGLDHWGVRPDILVAAKGATSGYWPFGFVAASGDVHDDGHRRRRRSSTASPTRTQPAGGGRRPRGAPDPRRRGPGRGQRDQGRAAPGAAPRTAGRAARTSARSAAAACSSASSSSPTATRARRSRGRPGSPRPSFARRAERGVLVYSGTGNANGVDGDRSCSGRRSSSPTTS